MLEMFEVVAAFRHSDRLHLKLRENLDQISTEPPHPTMVNIITLVEKGTLRCWCTLIIGFIQGYVEVEV